MGRLALLLATIVGAAAACGEGAVPPPSPSPVAIATPSPTPAATLPIATPIPTPTARPSPAPTPAPSPTPRPTATPAPSPSPSPPTPGAGAAQVVRKGDLGRKMVAFTFDAGADVGFVGQILDTLKANGIVASFGITGRWAEQNPEMLRRIVQEGHQLINHSYDHASFTGLSTSKPPLTQAQRWEELDRTESIVASLTGASAKPYFRPPYGDYDASVNADVYARGYIYNVLWTVDSRGWQGISAKEIAERCLSLAEPGAIYVFHVGSASQDAAALQQIIDGLRAEGYVIGSVPQVLGQ